MIELIPAIDIIDGKCVRLTQGDYDRKTIYDYSPLEMAKLYEDIGIRRLHVVDLDGAKKGRVVNLKTLEAIASNTSLITDFGGGIKDDTSINDVFNAGASIATIGSIAVKDPTLFGKWLIKYDADKILLGADVKDEKLMVSGWLEKSDDSIFEFITNNLSLGLKQYFCTDISKDGLLEGPSLVLYSKLIEKFPSLKLTASGGVKSMDDIFQLNELGCAGVIVGKAIYEKYISLDDIKLFIKKYYAN